LPVVQRDGSCLLNPDLNLLQSYLKLQCLSSVKVF